MGAMMLVHGLEPRWIRGVLVVRRMWRGADELFAEEEQTAARVIHVMTRGGRTRLPDTVELPRLRELRRASQETVAGRVGIRHCTLARMEKGNDTTRTSAL